MSTITYIVNGQKTDVPAQKNETLLSIGLEAGVPIEYACGGHGFCTTCKCKVTEGAEHLNELNHNEENIGVEPPHRLGCQATVESDGDITVEIDD